MCYLVLLVINDSLLTLELKSEKDCKLLADIVHNTHVNFKKLGSMHITSLTHNLQSLFFFFCWHMTFYAAITAYMFNTTKNLCSNFHWVSPSLWLGEKCSLALDYKLIFFFNVLFVDLTLWGKKGQRTRICACDRQRKAQSKDSR